MHVEKNVCDSLIGTLLNINNNKKDGLNARLDFIEMNILLSLLVSKFKKGGELSFEKISQTKLFSSNHVKKNRLILKITDLFSNYFIKSRTLTRLV